LTNRLICIKLLTINNINNMKQGETFEKFSKIYETELRERLPESIDTETTIFSYGYLLDIDNLKELLQGARGEKKFCIHETSDVQKADELANSHPNDIVILHNVVLEGVRRFVVNEEQLTNLFKKELSKQGKTWNDYEKKMKNKYNYELGEEPERHAYLYVVPAKPDEKSKTLNGGLILGLNASELKMLDDYEYKPVYTRQPTKKLCINEKPYTTEHITFYAGSVGNPHTEKTMEKTREILYEGKLEKKGKLPSTAKWPHDINK